MIFCDKTPNLSYRHFNTHIYYTIFRHKCQYKVAVLHKAFSSPPVCCYFISFPNLLDSCDSAVKYSYNDSRKDRLSHFYHLLSFVLYTLYHLIIVNKSVIFKNFFVYVFAHLSRFNGIYITISTKLFSMILTKSTFVI